MYKLIFNLLHRFSKYNYKSQLKRINSIKTKNQLEDFQNKSLEKLLLHAYSNVFYYHKIFNDIGLIKDGKVNMSKLDQIPVLTKEIIQKHKNELISKDYKLRGFFKNSSGGSTGQPAEFIQDKNYNQWGNAMLENYYTNYLGVDILTDKKIYLWGSERDVFFGSIGFKAKVINWLKKTVFLNAFQITKKDQLNYLNIINKYKPVYIRAYAGSIYELARIANDNNIKMYSPRAIISSAETLTSSMRKTIEKAFGCKVYDFYGSREVGPMSGECKQGHMHEFGLVNYIETEKIPGTKLSKVIVTNLHNYSMPFIRYEIGDMVDVRHLKSKELLKTIGKVSGRITDFFYKKNGEMIHGEYFTHLFYFRDWVKEFRIIQESYDTIKILLIKKQSVLAKDKKEIDEKIRLVMGKGVKIIWKYTNYIHPTKSGKYLFTQSKLKK